MSKIIKNKIVYEENINNIKGKAVAIVFPETLQEIKTLVKMSNQDIIVRANGTSFTGATIPQDSIILDLSKLNKIIAIDQEKKIVKVEPGILLSDLNDELEQYNLEFPIKPLFAGVETIGGMLAKNSAGNNEIKYGRMMARVDSLEIINSKGEQTRVSKSDLSEIVGMEGTTGIIISATLRLAEKKHRTMMILKAEDLDNVFSSNKKLRLNMDVSAIDLINRELSQILGLEPKYHIFVELENDKGNIKGSDFEKFTKLKNQIYKKAAMRRFYVLENAKFLVDSMQDFLIYLESKKIPYFSHLASGCVYFTFQPEEIDKHEEALKFAKKLNGKIGYNFGVGLTHKKYLEPGEKELIKRVKTRLDKNNKFNIDKMLDSYFETMKRKNMPVIKELPEPEPLIIEEKSETVETAEDIIEEVKFEQQEQKEKQESQDLFLEKSPDAQLTVGDIMRESERKTLKKPDSNLSDEEREKIKRIAAGFFAGGKEKQ